MDIVRNTLPFTALASSLLRYQLPRQPIMEPTVFEDLLSRPFPSPVDLLWLFSNIVRV